MPDDFEQRLRRGAGQFAANLTPPSADRIRARGDRRRRRKIAGSVALALLVIAGGGGTAYALGQPDRPPPALTRPAPTSTATASPGVTSPPASPPASATTSPGTTGSPGRGTAGTTTLRLGPLALRVPRSWRVTYHDSRGDYTVSTGSCAGADLIEAAGGSPCPSFSLIADVTPVISGAPGVPDYVPGQAWNPSSGVVGCPARPSASWLRDFQARPYSSGYAPVTAARTADYTVWQFGCDHSAGAPPVFYFQQRDWYLPVEKILIVDEYSIPGLAHVLAAGTWAG